MTSKTIQEAVEELHNKLITANHVEMDEHIREAIISVLLKVKEELPDGKTGNAVYNSCIRDCHSVIDRMIKEAE